MEQQLSIHIKNFNKRVQVMNQTNAKELVLTKFEAQNLQNEIFDLLVKINDLVSVKREEARDAANVEFDGGNF